MTQGNRNRIFAALLAAAAAVVARPSSAQAGDALVFAAKAAPGSRAVAELAPCAEWWRARDERRFATDLGGALALDLGASPESASSRTAAALALDALRRPGEAGRDALLLLGVAGDASTIGLLESVLADDLVGRRLTGTAPVAPDRRAAAALALGLVGRPFAFGALRARRAEPGAAEPEVAAATALALALADDPRDDVDFSSFLADGRGGSAVREAVAAASFLRGRPASFAPGSGARWLAAEPGGAGRGVAAAAFWRTDAVADADLAAAAAESPDAVSRAHALLALAARGDRRAASLAELHLAGSPVERSYGVVAFALRAKACAQDATGEDEAAAAFAAHAGAAPSGALVGEAVLARSARKKPLESRVVRDVRRLAGAHAGLAGLPGVASAIDRLRRALDPRP